MTTKSQQGILRNALFGTMPPRKPYRNYFCVSVGGDNEPDIFALIESGLMRRGEPLNGGTQYYVYVTEAGASEIGAKLPKESAS